MPDRQISAARLRKVMRLQGMTINQSRWLLTALSPFGIGWGAWTLRPDVIAAHGTVPWLSVSLLIESLVTILLCFWISTLVKRTKRQGPPLNAEFLFYLFLSGPNCDALVGDLEERFRLIHKKFGKRHADLWYWFQTFISLRPIIWAAMKKISGLMALLETFRRMRS